MGLCIHFTGSLNNKNQIEDLIDEVEDICKSMDWKYTILRENWNEHDKNLTALENRRFKGITFKPHPESENLTIFFDRIGRIASNTEIFFGEKTKPNYQFIKTQFAGTDVHIGVIQFLRYIKKKYIANLVVIDEANYWETNDRNKVDNYINIVNKGINDIVGIAKNSTELNDFLNKLYKIFDSKK